MLRDEQQAARAEEERFDVRLVPHHLRRNVLDNSKLDEHLSALPDDAEHGAETTTRFEKIFDARS